MAAPKRGLGKGLGALIPSAPAPTAASATTGSAAAPAKGGRATTASSATSTRPTRATRTTAAATTPAVYAELALDSVVPNPRQPRAIFDDDELAELAFSIREIGLLQPIVVREVDGGYELIAGERRLRASRLAGLTAIPAIIRSTDDDAMLRDALLENLHRSNLNALEEAAAYQQLLADFGCTQEELASRIGRSRPQVSNTLRLLKLPPDVQKRVAAGVLSAGHARALLSLEDAEAMDAMATRIVAEGLSVRAVEELVILTAGSAKERRPRARGARGRDAQAQAIVEELVHRTADALDTRVGSEGFGTLRGRGRLVIECADVEDLRRIVDAIGG